MAHLPYPSGRGPGQQPRRPRRSRFAFGGGVAAVAVAIGVIATSGGADTAEADSTSRSTSDVTIKESGLTKDATSGTPSYFVHYEITNTGKRSADYAAQLRFLDANGHVLGATDVDTSRLASGDTTSSTTTADLDSAKVGDIVTVEIGSVDRAETR